MLNSILLIGLGTPEIILIIVAILILFGGKKIPELMRGMGKGVKEFKDAQNSEKPVGQNEDQRSN
jgi:sec-independent protein translocase protein TatA